VRAWPILAAAGLVGCASGAVLEVELTLPPAEAGTVFYVVQVRAAEGHPFDAEWRDAEDVPPLQLGPEPLLDRISVVTEDVEQALHVRVAFCPEDACANPSDLPGAPQRQYVLERPFFAGRRSEWHEAVEALPTGVEPDITIGRCAIRACVTGDRAADYCLEDGTHPCD
jgi:hypothetical protein